MYLSLIYVKISNILDVYLDSQIILFFWLFFCKTVKTFTFTLDRFRLLFDLKGYIMRIDQNLGFLYMGVIIFLHALKVFHNFQYEIWWCLKHTIKKFFINIKKIKRLYTIFYYITKNDDGFLMTLKNHGIVLFMHVYMISGILEIIKSNNSEVF